MSAFSSKTETPAFVHEAAQKVKEMIERMEDSKWTLQLADEMMGASDMYAVMNSPFFYPSIEAMESEMKRRIEKDISLQDSTIYGDIATRRVKAMSEALNIYNQTKLEYVRFNH